MKYARWRIPELPEDKIAALMDAGYPYLVSSVLVSRGTETPEQAVKESIPIVSSSVIFFLFIAVILFFSFLFFTNRSVGW